MKVKRSIELININKKNVLAIIISRMLSCQLLEQSIFFSLSFAITGLLRITHEIEIKKRS